MQGQLTVAVLASWHKVARCYVLIIEYIRVLSYLKGIPNYETILTFMSGILHFIALIYVIFVQKSMSINAFYLLE